MPQLLPRAQAGRADRLMDGGTLLVVLGFVGLFGVIWTLRSR
jgi:hypothetical protein